MRHTVVRAALAAGAVFLASSSVFAQGNHLRVAVPGVPPGLGNPYTSGTFTSPNIFFYLAMYDGLTLVSEQGDTKASLAASWKNVDKNTWQVTIRPNVTFTSGRPVNEIGRASCRERV